VYHELALQNVMIGEPAFVTKALDGLTQEFTQTKAAAKASGIHTISEINNLLISAQKERNDRKTTDITSLNTEGRDNRFRRYCTRCRTETHNTSHCWILHPELRPSNNNANHNRSNTSRRNQRNFPNGGQRRGNQRRNNTNERPSSYNTQEEQNNNEPEIFTGYHTFSDETSDAMTSSSTVEPTKV
jgi:hypothetical protein